jgi:hypothetical protein
MEAFTLEFKAGAFDTVLFDVYLSIWVVATAALIGSLMNTPLPSSSGGGSCCTYRPFGSWWRGSAIRRETTTARFRRAHRRAARRGRTQRILEVDGV